MLGGLEVPFDRGLTGHSDADVLAHAVCDALLGAAALGDIGQHFPPGDPRFKDAAGLSLLTASRALLAASGYRVGNVDATVVAEAPRLAPFIAEMRRLMAEALLVDVSSVSIKATTTEGLGFAGRGEGIASYAIASIVPNAGPGEIESEE